MKRDPRMKKVDGVFVCVVCGGELNSLCITNSDPFCRTQCCNEWHGFEPVYTKVTLGGNPA